MEAMKRPAATIVLRGPAIPAAGGGLGGAVEVPGSSRAWGLPTVADDTAERRLQGRA